MTRCPAPWTRRRFCFACTAVLAAVAVFRYGVLDRSRPCAMRASRSSATRWSSWTHAGASPTSTARPPRCWAEAGPPRRAGSSTICSRASAHLAASRARRPAASDDAGERVFDASITPIRTPDQRLRRICRAAARRHRAAAPGGATPPGAEDGSRRQAGRRRRARLQQPADGHHRLRVAGQRRSARRRLRARLAGPDPAARPSRRRR